MSKNLKTRALKQTPALSFLYASLSLMLGQCAFATESIEDPKYHNTNTAHFSHQVTGEGQAAIELNGEKDIEFNLATVGSDLNLTSQHGDALSAIDAQGEIKLGQASTNVINIKGQGSHGINISGQDLSVELDAKGHIYINGSESGSAIYNNGATLDINNLYNNQYIYIGNDGFQALSLNGIEALGGKTSVLTNQSFIAGKETGIKLSGDAKVSIEANKALDSTGLGNNIGLFDDNK